MGLITVSCIAIAVLLFLVARSSQTERIHPKIDSQDLCLLIPIHNGAKRITGLVEQLKGFVPHDQQILFVLNGCTDASEEVLSAVLPKEWTKAELLNLPEAHKKKAILAATEKITVRRVLLLDDDINIHPKAQLKDYLARADADICCYGLELKRPENCGPWLWLLQVTEWAYLQFLTVGVKAQYQTMANGACLLFNKEIAKPAYANNLHLKTGDDVFLIDYAQQHQLKIEQQQRGFASVEAKPNLASFNQQRLRWASKNSSYKSRTLNLGASLFMLRFVLPFAVIWNHAEAAMFAYVALAAVEFYLIRKYHREFTLASYVVLLIFPACYIPLFFDWIKSKR